MLSLLPFVREMYRPCPVACASVSRTTSMLRIRHRYLISRSDQRYGGELPFVRSSGRRWRRNSARHDHAIVMTPTTPGRDRISAYHSTPESATYENLSTIANNRTKR